MNENIEAASSEAPFVSAILVVRNEESNIGRILGQIFGQDYPSSRLEVIVVDGQSEDRTAEIASSFSVSNGKPILIRLSERGRSQGLNRGILAAKGEVIVRVDARTSIESDYISRCVETLEQTGADNVGGVQCPIAESHRQEAIGLALSHPFGVGNAQFRLGRKSGFVDTAYLGCFRREIFNRVGLFDEQAVVISEDSDINQRIRKAGGAVYLNNQIKAYYYPREKLGDFLRLYYRYGGARAGNFLKHKTLTSWRQVIPPLFLLMLVSSGAISLVNGHYVFWSVLTAYFLANLTFSAMIASNRRKLVLIPLLMCAFAYMHFGYAAGFWKRFLTPAKVGEFWKN